MYAPGDLENENARNYQRDGIPYEIGVARYREIARGQIIGDTIGMLKLLFHSESRDLLANAGFQDITRLQDVAGLAGVAAGRLLS